MAYRSSDQSEALTAANDAATLLRLAGEALQLVRDRVHGGAYEETDALFREVSALVRRAEGLEGEVAAYFTERARRRSAPLR